LASSQASRSAAAVDTRSRSVRGTSRAVVSGSATAERRRLVRAGGVELVGCTAAVGLGPQLRGYGERAQTRTDHLREVLRYAGWRVVGAPEWKQLDEFLVARAMEHDSPKVLFGSACEYLLSEQVVRPGAVLLLEHVAAARERARRETWTLLAPQLADPARRAELDELLVVDPALGRTPLAWLQSGPTSASPAVVKTELAKLAFLRGLDADSLDLSMLPAQRRRFLAGLGRRLTAQALACVPRNSVGLEVLIWG